eukprot:94757-Hanusia_phi.AAC.2
MSHRFYAGKASKATAAGFRYAAMLMDVCKQFGELSPDIAEKCKYAKFQALEIMKAIKAGVVPLPPQLQGTQDGGFAEEEEDDGVPLPPPSDLPPQDPWPSSSRASNTVVEDIPEVPPPYHQDDFIKPPAPIVKPEPAKLNPGASNASSIPGGNERDPGLDSVPGVPEFRSHPVKPAPAPPRTIDVSGKLVPKKIVSPRSLDKAEKHTKFALSAIQFDDLREAVSNLQMNEPTLFDTILRCLTVLHGNCPSNNSVGPFKPWVTPKPWRQQRT